MQNSGIPWSFADYKFLYENYNTLGPVECAKELNRSVSSVENKAEKLKISRQGSFKQYELDYASTYGKSLGTALIFLLPHRTTCEVRELLECRKRN